MQDDKLVSQDLNDLQLERAKKVLATLKAENTKSGSGPDIWFCNGHNKISKEGLELYNRAVENTKKGSGPDQWYCNGHSK